MRQRIFSLEEINLPLGPSGEQVSEMAVSGSTLTWSHTNVSAGGMLLATYDNTGKGLHFYLDDPLGTRRVQTDYLGVLEQTCASLPFGDDLTCSGSATTPTEHHFTGKERDSESGNDYFEARYYASSMGRFMSPDWSAKVEPVPYSKLDDPQSLNLYAYVRNNPMTGYDADGHDDSAPGGDAYNSTAGQAQLAFEEGGDPAAAAMAWGASTGTPKTQNGQQTQQQGLSSKSGKAVDKAAKKYGYDASVFKAAMTQAGSKYKLNPNLLVGLGMRESSLNPSQSNGGLFQIQDPKAYGIDPKDIGNFEVQIPAAAAFLSGNISHFNGNVDLGVAAWTLGRGGTSHFFNEGGMPAVRGALLSAKHPDYGTVGGYVDFITSF